MRYSITFPGTEVRLTGWWFPGFSFSPVLKTGVPFASCQSSGTSPDHHNPSKIPSRPMDLWMPSLPVWSLTQSSLAKGKSSFHQSFTLVSWIRDPRGSLIRRSCQGGLIQRRCSVTLLSLHSVCLLLVNSTAWLQRKVTGPLLELHQFVSSVVSIWREQATILRLLAFSETISGENFYLH